ncbi:glycosyltransferase [Isoptericola sp. NPDC055881]
MTPVADVLAHYLVGPGDQVDLRIGAFRDHDVDRAALFTIEFRDEHREVVAPAGDLPVNPRFGPYIYLPDGEQPLATLEVSLQAPPRARMITIRGHQWRKGVANHVTELEVRRAPSSATDHSLEDALSGLAVDDTVVIIYSTAPPVGHETLSLRPNRLAREYAAAGHHVIFMPFGSLGDYPEQPDPRILQVEGKQLSALFTALAHRTGPSTVFICSSYPDVRTVLAIDTAKARRWRTVYEVRDEMEEFNRVGYSKWFRPMLESRVARAADDVVTVSPRLAEKMNAISGRTDAIVVPNGVTDDLLRSTAHLRTLDSVTGRPRDPVVVGYIGHLTPSWFDWESVVDAAVAMPDVRFEIVGHGIPDGLRLPENVAALGPRTHDECRAIAAGWTVGMIPFRPSPLTTAVDPNKLYEYLAFGLRVVSVEMGSVTESPLTFVYRRSDELAETLRVALAHQVDKADVQSMERYLASVRWSARAEEMRQHVGF